MSKGEAKEELEEQIKEILLGNIESYENEQYVLYKEKCNLYTALIYQEKKSGSISKRYIEISSDESSQVISDNYLLPIGTVVKVANKNLMVVGRAMEEKGQVFDYTAVLYPEGLITNEVQKFNQGQVQEIIHLGLEDEKNLVLTQQIKSGLDNLRSTHDYLER